MQQEKKNCYKADKNMSEMIVAICLKRRRMRGYAREARAIKVRRQRMQTRSD